MSDAQHAHRTLFRRSFFAMNRIVRLSAFALLLAMVADARAQFGLNKMESVAITEFMNSAVGYQDGRQWVELYNFGKEPVELKGFQLTDNGNQVCDIPEVT